MSAMSGDRLPDAPHDDEPLILSDVHTSTIQPICPHCLKSQRPIGPEYFDEQTTRLECQTCGEMYRVSIHTATTWTTWAVAQSED